jgi:hypothetical protein
MSQAICSSLAQTAAVSYLLQKVLLLLMSARHASVVRTAHCHVANGEEGG